MPKQQLHVVKNNDKKDNKWGVKRAGGQRASSRHSTQREAENAAKQFARNQFARNQDRVEVVIHRPDGTIRDKDTLPPGNDPFPPRDTKH